MNQKQAPSVPAPMWRRLAAMVYECMALFALAFGATAVLMALLQRDVIPAGSLGYQCYLLGVFKIYFVIGWRRGGQSLGMRAWGLYLESVDPPLSWRRAMLRYWVAVASWVPVGLGYWWALIDRDRRAWPDLAAGTRVIWRPA